VTRLRALGCSAHVNAEKTYLFQELQHLGFQVKRCYGWMTSYWRKQIGLDKSHVHDAIAMVCRNYTPQQCHKDYLIIPKRRKVWEDNPTKTCEEKHSFRHFDVVKAHRRNRGMIIGSVRSLKARVMTLRTTFDDNFAVSYNKSQILYRFNAIIYI